MTSRTLIKGHVVAASLADRVEGDDDGGAQAAQQAAGPSRQVDNHRPPEDSPDRGR